MFISSFLLLFVYCGLISDMINLIDTTINELFNNLATVVKMAKSDDPTIRMSALMIFGNMARSGILLKTINVFIFLNYLLLSR